LTGLISLTSSGFVAQLGGMRHHFGNQYGSEKTKAFVAADGNRLGIKPRSLQPFQLEGQRAVRLVFNPPPDSLSVVTTTNPVVLASVVGRHERLVYSDSPDQVGRCCGSCRRTSGAYPFCALRI
jgi:hypothetical protein